MASSSGLTFPENLILAINDDNQALINTYFALNKKKINEFLTNDLKTSLHLAVLQNKISIVKLLLIYNADLNIKDSNKKSPLDYAVDMKHIRIIQLMDDYMQRPGDINEYPDSDEIPQIRVENLERSPFAKGAEGEIFRCQFQTKPAICKGLFKGYNKAMLQSLQTEILILSKLKHPNIITLYGIVSLTEQEPPKMILEYCQNGTLEARLIRANSRDPSKHIYLDSQRKLAFALQLINALQYLHEILLIPICHRDLKPGNVLLDLDDNIKLCDFGLARYFFPLSETHENPVLMTGETGSYRFMAPEVFQHKYYDEKCDIFSYGMICYWIFSGHRPFFEIDDGVKVAQLTSLKEKRPEIELVKEKQIRPIITRCWEHDPQNRPKPSEIIEKFGMIHSLEQSLENSPSWSPFKLLGRGRTSAKKLNDLKKKTSVLEYADDDILDD